MRASYDFSDAKPNPYAKRLKKQVTIRLDQQTIGYFRMLADEMDVPYQTLINLYLRDCAAKGKRLALHWKPAASQPSRTGRWRPTRRERAAHSHGV